MSGIIGGAGSESGIIGSLGAIYSSGSNANGDYIKFENGALIQWFRTRADGDRPATTTEWEDTFYRSSDTTRTFPVAFKEIDHTVIANGNSSSAFVWCVAENTGTLTTTSIMMFSDRSSATAGLYSFIAIGTWK